MTKKNNELPPGVRYKPLADGTPSYQVTVCLRRDGLGKQERRYRTFTPPEGMGKREVRKELERIRSELLNERINTNSLEAGQTLRQFAAVFLSDREFAGCTPKTLDNYQRLLDRILAELGNVPLNQLTSERIQAFYRKLTKEPNRRKHSTAVALPALKKLTTARKVKGAVLARQAGVSASVANMALRGEPVSVQTAEKLSAALEKPMSSIFLIQKPEETLSVGTVLSYHRAMRSMLSLAVKKKLVKVNECDFVTLPKQKKQEQPTLQPEEIARLFQVLEGEPLEWQALVHLALVTGARRGEVVGLKWENLDFETGVLTVDHALHYLPQTGLYEGETKTKQTRFNHLPGQTLELLQRWRAQQAKAALSSGDMWERTGYIFTGEKGQPLRPDSISQYIHKLSEKCDIPGLHTHTFRHTAASVLIGAGVDVVTVASQLGHADPATTAKIYAHVIEQNKVKAAEALGAAVYSAQKSRPAKNG